MEFNEIYSEHHPQIERWLISRLPSQEDAEEIASEVFVRVHANLDTFNEELAGIRTWIWKIARNLMIDHLRKEKGILLDSIDETYQDDSTEVIQLVDSSDPQREMESSEIGEEILKAMIELPKTVSDVAEKYFINELTYKEIAEDLSVPMGTVQAHIFRARKCLQKRLMSFR